ncbi:unnamed protein product, partial [Ectocarpus sp. 4 AP-2014]
IDYQPFYNYIDQAPEPLSNADFDADGDVDGGDFLSWQLGYGMPSGASSLQGDANGNGRVNGYDLLAWQEGFGTPMSPPVTVPEPSRLSLLLAVASVSAAAARR